VIWSTLESTTETLKDDDKLEDGLFHVPHFDGKNEANAYFEDLPTTYLYTSFYYSNFIYFGLGPKAKPDTEDYQIFFNMDDVPLAMVDVDDIGQMAAKIFNNPTYKNKHVAVASDFMTGT